MRDYLRRLLNAARHILARGRRQGYRSAFAYLKSRLANVYIRRRNNRGASRVECPICGWHGYDFLTLDCGTFTVPHVICPQCQSHERHRLLHLYLARQDNDFFQRSGLVLHFAPEQHVRNLIDANPKFRCFSTDYARGPIQQLSGSAFQADMQRLPLPDEAFHVIFCLHVLEHVPDDRVGIAELHRVLKKDGVAYIMVPFMMGWKKTVEFGAPDPDIFDHVRGYAPGDFSKRLQPFNFEEVCAPTFLSQEEIRRYAIPPDSQVIYRCARS